MTGFEHWLVIILGVFFAILLILSIVVVAIFVRILQNIHSITKKAEATTENLSETIKVLGKKIAPVAVSTLIGALFKRYKGRNKDEE